MKVPRIGVRPTMDRVKAAIFSSLGEKVIGARVLDLFAGAGGLGIEAMSSGAASAVFVESNPNAARVVERNLAIVARGNEYDYSFGEWLDFPGESNVPRS